MQCLRKVIWFSTQIAISFRCSLELRKKKEMDEEEKSSTLQWRVEQLHGVQTCTAGDPPATVWCRPQWTENPFISGVPCAGHRDGRLRTPLSVVCPVQATETADWEPLYRWCALCRPQRRRTENPFISGVQSAVCTTVQSHQLFSFFKHPHPLLIFIIFI